MFSDNELILQKLKNNYSYNMENHNYEFDISLDGDDELIDVMFFNSPYNMKYSFTQDNLKLQGVVPFLNSCGDLIIKHNGSFSEREPLLSNSNNSKNNGYFRGYSYLQKMKVFLIYKTNKSSIKKTPVYTFRMNSELIKEVISNSQDLGTNEMEWEEFKIPKYCRTSHNKELLEDNKFEIYQNTLISGNIREICYSLEKQKNFEVTSDFLVVKNSKIRKFKENINNTLEYFENTSKNHIDFYSDVKNWNNLYISRLKELPIYDKDNNQNKIVVAFEKNNEIYYIVEGIFYFPIVKNQEIENILYRYDCGNDLSSFNKKEQNLLKEYFKFRGVKNLYESKIIG